jgi:outer membrane protein OmpA-like peptidoglycan-associated protein
MTLKTDRPLHRSSIRSLPDALRLLPRALLAVAALAGGQRAAAAAGPEEAASPEATATAVAPPAAEAATSADDPAVFLPSLTGPVGLYHMSTAEVGPAHHLRFGLHGQYFQASSFLLNGDKDSMLAGQLTFGFTLNPYFEIFGGILTTSNRNVRDSTEIGRTDPEVIRTHGDLLIGPKVVLPVATGFSIGLEGGLRFLASASSLSFSPSSTSAWIGPLATIDLRPLAHAPLRFHVNANYYADNSSNVYNLDGTTLSSRLASKYAYGIEASRLRFAVGIDAPLEKWTAPVPLRPFAEYHAEIITAGADSALVDVAGAGGPRDRQWLTFGLRVNVYRGATVDAGVDLRLKNAAMAYEPPLPPYNVIFGLSYPLDVDSFRKPVIVTQVVEKPALAPPPSDGRIAGVAKDKAGKPIARAIVAVAGRAHATVVTDADGTFEIAGLVPGPANVEVQAPDFESEKATTNVTAGQTVEVAVALTPRARTGSVRGKTTDAQGRAVEATLKFSGAQAFETRTDGGGLYQAALLPGPYKVVAEAPGLPSKESQFEVVADGSRQVDLTLRPMNPDLTLTADEIVLKSPIKFKQGPAKLTPEWQTELDGVVEILEDRPDIRVLRIEAHWDPSAGPKAKKITDGQAASVKEYLVKKGITDARIEAVGMGSDQPLVPNVTPAYKAKNRRVELHMIR